MPSRDPFPVLARFVGRPSKEGSKKPDVGIIAFFKGNNALKADRIYEIIDVMGELTIKDVGPAAIAYDLRDSLVGAGWGSSVGHILDVAGGRVILTRDEAIEDYPPEERERLRRKSR